ncbi:hypothetical protein F7725_020019 [Dissostichus mawsoni]|uniref:Uncharacterized protein n=1 Tax=Dissostichus mawsoni TaxID=36200 RepID=A0A7J5YLQ7_DISMA|nr:hypothetical protein F7725_020019 [Dissostichus mawsoni]
MKRHQKTQSDEKQPKKHKKSKNWHETAAHQTRHKSPLSSGKPVLSSISRLKASPPLPQHQLSRGEDLQAPQHVAPHDVEVGLGVQGPHQRHDLITPAQLSTWGGKTHLSGD